MSLISLRERLVERLAPASAWPTDPWPGASYILL